MTGPDYEVSPAALAETAAGIEGAIDGLRPYVTPGIAHVAQLGLLPGDVGHAGLSSAFVGFCDRWEWGLRDAVRLGEELADDLRATGAAYGHADGAGADLLARVVFDVVGDPGVFGDTWDDVAAATAPERAMPDWGELGRQWADTVGDLADRSWPGMIARALRGENPSAGELDDLRPIVE